MPTSQIAIKGKLNQSLSEYADAPCCQEVLEFLKRHPHTQFSRLAIVHALNSHRLCTERALSYLTDSGVIRKYLKNNVPFYSLGGGNRVG
jgi:N-glycosylase/DNA lyase